MKRILIPLGLSVSLLLAAPLAIAGDDAINGGTDTTPPPISSEPSAPDTTGLTIGEMAGKLDVDSGEFAMRIAHEFGLSQVDTNTKLSELDENEATTIATLKQIAQDIHEENRVKLPNIPTEQLKEMTVEQAAETYGIDADEFALAITDHFRLGSVRPTDHLGSLNEVMGVDLEEVKEVAAQVKRGKGPGIGERVSGFFGKLFSKIKEFNFWRISAVLIAIYLVSLLLNRLGLLPARIHKFVWNNLLWVALVVTGVLAILLAVETISSLPFAALNWLIYAAIALFWLIIFRIAEYLSGLFGGLQRK